MRHHTPYVGDAKVYENYYCSQVGHGLPVFVGGRNIRGRGLGNILGGLGRSVIPLLKSGGKALLKQGAKAGMEVVQDVLSGKSVKSALKNRTKAAGKRLLSEALGEVSQMTGPPGKRIRRSPSRKTSQKASSNKRRRRRQPDADIFS